MKKYILLLLSIISFGVMAQTVPTLPTGAKPYGNQLYIVPSTGLIYSGNSGYQYRVVGTKSYVDSLVNLGYRKTQVDSLFSLGYRKTQVDSLLLLKASTVALENEINRATAAENTKANAADINSPINILFSDITANTYTNVLFANQTVTILYKNPTTFDKATATFNSSGVLTLPFTAVSGFTATLIGTTGALGNYLTSSTGVLKTPQTDYVFSLVDYTPNLYNASNVQLNKYINSTTGALVTLTNPIVTEYIPVDASKTYSIRSVVNLGLTNFRTIAFYNAAKVPIGWSARNPSTGLPTNTNCNVTYNAYFGWDTGTLPIGAAYVIFSLRGNDTSTTWQTAGVTMREGDATQDIVSHIITDETIEPYLTDFITQTELGVSNSFTPVYTEGSLYNISGGGAGNVISSATWLRTGLFPVTAGETMFVKGVLGGGNFYIVCYNSATPSSATYITNIRPNYAANALRVYDFVIPVGTTHIGFNIGTNTVYTFAQLKAVFQFSKNQSFSTDNTLIGYTVKKENVINLSNLVWNSGGDSITWQDGKNYTTGLEAGQLAIGYQTLVRNVIQFKNHNNVATSGFALSASSPDDGKCWMRQSGTWPVADVFTLAHGTNDFGLNRQLGTTADYINKTGDLTFYGALREFIDYCYTANPNYKIILITPLQRNSTYSTLTPNAAGFYLNDYANAIRWVGERESLAVIDWLKYGGINLKNIASLTSDNLHPTNPGYKVVALPVISEMIKLNYAR